MDVTLGMTGLLRYFEGRVFSVSQVGRGKPAPDLFLFAAASLGVDPADCAVIEDSRAGVEAGVAAGMTVFGYAPPGTSQDLDLPGVRRFAAMSELRQPLGVQVTQRRGL